MRSDGHRALLDSKQHKALSTQAASAFFFLFGFAIVGFMRQS
jgi:hypothetical protein